MGTTATKGALRSKTIIGALLTIIGALGLWGVGYDPVTHQITIDLDDLFDAGFAALVPGGGVLAIIGRLTVGKVIDRLF